MHDVRVSDRRQQVQAVALALLVALCGTAHADDAAERAADAAFRAASQRAQTDLAGALAAFEELGARTPVTRWTDNAWAEAARLAEATKDYARARADLERVIAIDADPVLVARARATLARIAAATGGGAWDAIAREHEALVAEIQGGGDPGAALARLAALVRANPAYPRATAARIAIARGYEQQGETGDALAWMREAAARAGDAEPGQRTRLELVRMALRADELGLARGELAALAGIATTDRAARGELVADLAAAERRAWLRRGVWLVLAVLAALALAMLRRDLGAWRAVARRVRRPPIEAVFLAPLSALVVAIAATGNPLVARAVIAIALAGLAVAWLSGVLVEGARTRRRLIAHVACVVLAVGCIAFLAVEGRVLALLAETWRGGHALR